MLVLKEAVYKLAKNEGQKNIFTYLWKYFRESLDILLKAHIHLYSMLKWSEIMFFRWECVAKYYFPW